MALDSAQIQYLQDILGVRDVLLPEDFQAEAEVSSDQLHTQSPATESDSSSWVDNIQGSLEARILLASQRDLQPRERELCQNIFKALGEEHLSILMLPNHKSVDWAPVSTLGSRAVLVFADLVSSDLSQSLNQGQVEQYGDARLLLTAKLSNMVEGSGDQVMAAKKIVWADIQPFKNQ